jgi:hypothetical protein
MFHFAFITRILSLGLALGCCASLATAQKLSGVITDIESNETLIGATITNKTTHTSLLTDFQGKYNITAHENDRIEIVSFGYEPLIFIMSNSENVYRNLGLKPKLVALKEVEIRPDFTPYQLDSIARRKTYNIALGKRYAGDNVMSAITSPASTVAELFSKKKKLTKRFQSNFIKWENEQYTSTVYTPELISSLTGLQHDSLASFMNTYPIAVDYARTATALEVKMWIKYNYREWIKNPKMIAPYVVDSLSHQAIDSLKK